MFSANTAIEGVEQLDAPGVARQAALLGLPDLVARLAIEAVPQAVRRLRQGQPHRHLVLLVGQIRKPALLVPQLQVRKSAAPRHLDGPVQQRPRHVLILGDDAAVIDERQRHARTGRTAGSGTRRAAGRRRRDRRARADRFSASGGRRPARRSRASRTGGTRTRRDAARRSRPTTRRRATAVTVGASERDRRHHQATAAEGARSSTADGGCAGRTSQSGANRKSRSSRRSRPSVRCRLR